MSLCSRLACATSSWRMVLHNTYCSMLLPLYQHSRIQKSDVMSEVMLVAVVVLLSVSGLCAVVA